MWGNSPTSTVGPHQAPPGTAGKYYSGISLESIRRSSAAARHPHVPHHPPIASLGCPVAEKSDSVVGRAPGRSGDVNEAEVARLSDQLVPQIEVPGSFPVGRGSASLHDFRTYFIALATYANPTMHYHTVYLASGLRLQTLDAAAQDSPGGAPPARVQQGDSLSRDYQVHRYTIGNGYGEQDAGRCGDPTIDPLDLDPAAAGIEAHELDAMYLVTESDCVELRKRPPKGSPSGHHLSNRCFTPEAQIEAPARIGSAGGDTGNDSILFPPTRDFESGDGAWNRDLADSDRL